MTLLLKKAIEQVQKLSTDRQDAIAGRMLQIIDNEQWDDLFARDPDLLLEMAASAMQEDAVEMGIDEL